MSLIENKALFIVNPAAGKGRGRKFLPFLENSLKSLSIHSTIIETKYLGHATEIAKSFLDDNALIFGVGGDGTINEIINGLNPTHKHKLGIIPIGSGNDFARAIGNIDKEFSILKYISTNKTLLCDVGHVIVTSNGSVILDKKFISSFGIGFDAFVASKIKTIKYLKGIFLYISSVFLSLLNYNASTGTISINDGEITIADKIFLFAVGNTKTAGGGFKLNPDAAIDDGYLDLCMTRNISKFTLLKVLPKAIFGTHIKHRLVETYRFTNLSYSTRERVFLHLDGEVLELEEGEKEIVLAILPSHQEVITNHKA